MIRNQSLSLRVCLSKIKAAETIFMAIFELTGVENPHKQPMGIEFEKFTILEKYYVCVQNFGQIWFS